MFGKTIQRFMRELCFQIAQKNINKLPQASVFFFLSLANRQEFFSEVLLVSINVLTQYSSKKV